MAPRGRPSTAVRRDPPIAGPTGCAARIYTKPSGMLAKIAHAGGAPPRRLLSLFSSTFRGRRSGTRPGRWCPIVVINRHADASGGTHEASIIPYRAAPLTTKSTSRSPQIEQRRKLVEPQSAPTTSVPTAAIRPQSITDDRACRLKSPLTKSYRRSSATSPKGGPSHLALLPLDVIDPPWTMRVEAPGHEKR
jgi:hypothetical protein